MTGFESSTSTGLLCRIKEFDQDAWEKLSELYGPLVYRWARRSGLNEADAADIVQDVFLSVMRGIQSFRKERLNDRFRTWLWVITRNKISNHHRSVRGIPQATGGTTANERLQQIPDAISESDSASVHQDATSRLISWLEQEFEPGTCRAFLETTLKHRTSSDVAAELGMTPKAVRQAKYRVLLRIRTEFGDPLS